MRILENCIDSSASSEVKGQIETLREAFSLDVNQPFVLNPNFPFYPGVSGPVDTSLTRAYTQAESSHPTLTAGPQVNYPTHPLSPPHSAGDGESKGESPAAVQSLVMLAASQGTQNLAPVVGTIAWNPSRLFEFVALCSALFDMIVHHAYQSIVIGMRHLGLMGRCPLLPLRRK
jgi:hypothetical protein